ADAELNDEIRVVITVHDVNREIEVGEIGDLEIDEDGDERPIVLVDLDDVFVDPDDVELTFRFEGAPNGMGMDILEEHILVIDPVQDFHTDGEPIEITVYADDHRDDEERLNGGPFGLLDMVQVDDQDNSVRGGPRRVIDDAPRRDEEVSVTFTITIDPVNDEPIVAEEIEDVEWAEDSGLHEVADLDDVFFDVDGDELLYEVIDDGEGLTVAIDEDTNILTITPDANYNGESDVIVQADDGVNQVMMVAHVGRQARNIRDAFAEQMTPRRDASVDDEFHVIITPVNDVPIITDPTDEDQISYDVNENAEIVIDFLATDVDLDIEGDELVWREEGIPNGAEFVDGGDDDESAMFTWTPTFDDAGDHVFLAIVEDEGDEGDTLEVTITVGDVNRAPVIVDPADPNIDEPLGDEIDVAGNEGEELVIPFHAIDPDADDLVWTVDDEGGLPEGWQFTDNEDGTASFVWTPGFHDEGLYNPVFDVTDGGALNDQLTVNITIDNTNQAPVVVQEIGDENDQVIFEEDEGLPDDRPLVIADLDDVFGDDDTDQDPNHNENLVFAIEGDVPEEINMTIDAETLVLGIDPDENYNLPDGVEITIIATDPEDAQVSESFTLIITPVNDAPDEFDLVSPENGTEINRQDNYVDLEWEAAADIEDDDVTYSLMINVVFEDVDTTHAIPDLEDTFFDVEDVEGLLLDLGVYIQWKGAITHEITWWVVATDGELDTESNQRWTLIVPIPVFVDDPDQTLPTEFSLSQNYPNPFNPSTHIEFGLPISSDVRVMVWDVSGRCVKVLVNGRMAAGYHTITWDAHGMPSGIYLFTLDTADGVRMIKRGALVR
ncbi:MAG: Ig-like domain-containing protein, partial [Candidatus Electryoneaceae bacterium]|nr:Ig-like domain-containing protein [Candidatus Electryoneaceae bacterium]